jgi:hypothetical protein
MLWDRARGRSSEKRELIERLPMLKNKSDSGGILYSPFDQLVFGCAISLVTFFMHERK